MTEGKKRSGGYRGTSSSEYAVASLLHSLQRRMDRMERSNQMTRGSVVGGPLNVYDDDENPTMQVGLQYDGSYVANPLVGPEPPVPSQPIVTPGLRSVSVFWDGTFDPLFAADGVTIVDDLVVAPMDFARIEIHASTNPAFDATSALTLVGTIETALGGEQIVPIPTTGEDYTIKLVCRTLPGKRGDASTGSLVRASDVETSDGLPPTESPTPVVIGQTGGIYLAWDAVDNADPVEYHIYASATPTVDIIEANRIADVTATAFLATVQKYVPLTRIPYDSDTYFSIVASDADGPAPAGPVVSGRAARLAATDLNDGIITLVKLAPAVQTSLTDAQTNALQALADAADAQATADGKTRTFFQTTAPTGMVAGDVGDLWFDTDDGNKMYRWSGTAWVVSQDQSLAETIKAYIQSRSTNLVTNGYGSLLNNTNFSAWTFTQADAPTGAAGSFLTPAAAGTERLDEFMPVDVTKPFRLDVTARETGSAQGYNYAFLEPYDSYRLAIATQHYMYIPGTTTTLAAPLNPGDTTITLTSSANWYGTAGKPAAANTHYRSIIWWDYVDAGGKAWAQHTYSRNWSGVNYWADGGVTGNVITLSAAYSGPARPAGTPLSNGSAGATYMYLPSICLTQVPTTWTTFGANVSGTVSQTGVGGTYAEMATGWPPATAYCKFGVIHNGTLAAINTYAAGSRLAIAAVTFSDAAAAAVVAASKITTFYQATTPTALAAGDLWVKTNDNNRLYRAVVAGANTIGAGGWVDARDATIAIAAAAAAQATTDASTALAAAADAQATADGKVRSFFQADPPTGMVADDVGDLWFDSNDGNKMYRWSGTAWVLSDDTRITTAINAAAAAQATADAKTAASLIQNPSRTGTMAGWQNPVGGSGATTVVEDVTFGGRTVKAIKFTTSGDSLLFTQPFSIEATQAYEIRMFVLDPTNTPTPSSIQFLVGEYVHNAAGTDVPVTPVARDTGAAEAPDTNHYAYYTATPATAWTEYVFYLLPAGTTPAEGKGLGVNVTSNAILPIDANRAIMRVLNWGNAGTPRSLWVVHPTVTPVSMEALRLGKARADAKITTFYQTAPPTSTAIGDLWVDTDDNNQLYRAASVGATTVGAGAWVSVRDASIATAASAAAAAQTTANSALTSANNAQATADGKISSYYQAAAPWADGAPGHDNDLGDLWYDTDDKIAYRWSGTAWVKIEDPRIAQALSAANTAQTTADGKIATYFLNDPPWANGAPGHTNDAGDLWYDTNDGNKAYYWTGTAWTALPIGMSGLGGDVTARNLGAITTTVGPTAPASPKDGDLWIDSANGNILKRYSAGTSTWASVQDAGIQSAITAATNAANMADSKMRIFYEAKHASGMYPASNPAMTSDDTGDLWFRLDEGNKPYRYDGSVWTAFVFGKGIAAPTDGLVPSTSPTPSVIPGIACVFLRWTAVTNPDPVTYRVYASRTSGFTPSVSNFIGETSGTTMTVNAIPVDSGSTIGPNIEHTTPAYFKIIAADGDGPSTVTGGQASGTGRQAAGEDVAFASLTSDHVVSKTITGELFSGSLLVGSTITTGSLDEDPESPTYGQIVGQSITLGPSGFYVKDSLGVPFISFPMNQNEDAIINSRLVTNNLVVKGGASIGGDGNEIARGGSLLLANSVGAPAAPVGLRLGYERFQFKRIVGVTHAPASGDLGSFALEYSQILSAAWSAGGNYWIIAQKRANGVRLWRYNADGQTLTGLIGAPGTPWIDDLVGWTDVTSLITYPHSILTGMFGRYNGTWYVSGLASTATDIANGTAPSGPVAINVAPAFESASASLKPVAFYDTTTKFVGIAETNVPNSGGRSVKVRNYSITDGLGATPVLRSSTISANTGVSIAAQLSGMVRTTAVGLGGNRYVWEWASNTSWLIGVSTLGGTGMVTAERWQPAAPSVAFMRDGSNFWSLSADGWVHKYTDWTWSDGLDYAHAAITWYDSDTAGTPTTGPNGIHETGLGAIASIFVPKRSRLIVDLPLPPDKGGVDDPDKWRLYMVRSGAAAPGSGSFRLQTEGSTATSLAYVAIGTAGSAPTPIPFPNETPALMYSAKASHTGAAGRTAFRLDGNGIGYWDALVPPGAMLPYGGNTPPSGYALPEVTPGWLICRGDVVSRSAYPALFAIIGTTFNLGGEAGTDFRLPDVRRRFLWGADPTANPVGSNDKIATVASRSPTHNHTIPDADMNLATNTTTGGTANRLTSGNTHNHGGNTGNSMWVSSGDTDPANTFPNLSVNVIIKY